MIVNYGSSLKSRRLWQADKQEEAEDNSMKNWAAVIATIIAKEEADGVIQSVA